MPGRHKGLVTLWAAVAGSMAVFGAGLFAAAFAVGGSWPWVCGIGAAVCTLLSLAGFYLAFAAHYEWWPFRPPEPPEPFIMWL